MPDQAALAGQRDVFAGRLLRGRYFYPALALLIVLVVAAAFARPRVVAELLHAPSLRPWILYAHIALSATWVVLFLVQATLVATRRIAWHRAIGRAGMVLGTLTAVAGIGTALVMTRRHLLAEGDDGSAFLALLLFDMLAFAVLFGLGIAFRRQADTHRRLMLMATCTMAMAAFLRFPHWLVPPNMWYAAVDALILVAAARDWLVERRVYAAFAYGLPALVAGQVAAMALFLEAPPAWIALAHTLLRWRTE